MKKMFFGLMVLTLSMGAMAQASQCIKLTSTELGGRVGEWDWEPDTSKLEIKCRNLVKSQRYPYYYTDVESSTSDGMNGMGQPATVYYKKFLCYGCD